MIFFRLKYIPKEIWFSLATLFFSVFLLNVDTFLSLELQYTIEKNTMSLFLKKGYIFFLYTFAFTTIFIFYKETLIHKISLFLLFQTFLISLLFTGFTFFYIGPEFRILADETNLLNVAQAFYQSGDFFHPLEGYFQNKEAIFTYTRIPHRAGLWSFLVFLLHKIVGYRVENGFLLNWIVSIIIIQVLLLYGHITRKIYRWYTISFLTATYPLYILCQNSSGFDILNLLFIILFLIYLFHYLKNKQPSYFIVSLFCAVLASNVRYESAILFVIPFLGISEKTIWNKKERMILFILPLFYLPLLCLRLLSSNLANEGDAITQAISFSLIPNHLLDATRFLFWYKDYKAEFPTSFLLSYLSVGGIYFFIKKNKTAIQFLFLSTLAIGTISLIHFSYYLGDYTFSVVNRYALIHLVWIIPFSAYFIEEVLRYIVSFCLQYKKEHLRYQSIIIRILIVIVLSAFSVYHTSIAQRNEKGNLLVLFLEYKFIYNFLKDIPDKNIAIFSDRPSMYLPLNLSSFYLKNWNYVKGKIINQYKEIYILQHIIGDNIMEPVVIEEPTDIISELQLTPNQKIRISKIKKTNE